MADLGATFADAEITATEKELKAVYNKAYKDILQKQKDFNKKYAAKEAKKLKQLASAQITQEEFDAWKAGQVFQSKQWEDKKKQILNTLYNTNSIAADIVNGKTSNVFSFNANYTAYSLEHGAGVNFGFGLYDSATVKNLIKNDPQLLPEWKIDQPKDYTWNQKKLNRQINLGIIEGESLDKIANRLSESLVSQNFNKMRTFARTAMTGAQNAGRQIRLEEAKKLGINVKKEWMATLDAHTRMTHRKLDGQKVDTDKSFDINGMSIRFPGDPLAPAALVYNCRCTMVGDLVNYPGTYDRYDNINGKRIKGMTYTEWEEAKKNGDDISPISLTFTQLKNSIEKNIFNVVNGRDLSDTWNRRPDQFDFEIEDVINAQGFDGLPRVVSAEEFERAVQEANDGNGFVAQRTYSAPNQETLDAYRKQLYKGEWYVDCSTGGAQYGQGMYCAADYTGKLSDGIKAEMAHYKGLYTINLRDDSIPIEDRNKMAVDYLTKQGITDEKELKYATAWLYKDKELVKELNLGSDRRDAINDLLRYADIQKPSYTETLTLDPSARIITYKELDSMRSYGNIQKKLIEEMDIESDQKSILKKVLVEDEEDSSVIENETIKKLGERIEKRADQLMEMDPGSFAAALGYDAINAEGHGQSGSYTVILNRTKCIFKGE